MKNGKKHVVIISPFARPNLGGVESHIEKLMRYANRKNFYVTLLTYFPLTNRDPAKSFEKGKNFEIYRLKWFGNNWFPVLEDYYPLVFLYLFPGLFFEAVLFFLKNASNVDCIHAHGLVAATITRIINIFTKKHSVISTHAVYTFEKKPLLNFVIKQILLGFNSVLAVSEVSKQELEKMGIPRVKVHPNWVETDVFKPLDREKVKKTYGITYKINFLFVGRFIERKGIKLILDAAKDLKKCGFHFVGTGPMNEEVIKSAEENPNVFYYGKLMQHIPEEFEKLLGLYNACDFLLSPYLYDEGFSATLIEALSCGTPVIVSNRGSPPTFLNDGVAIFLSSEPTSKELVEVLSNIESKNLADMPKKCRDYAIEHFGYKNADVIINSYTKS